MEFLWQKIRDLRGIRTSGEEERRKREISRFEGYFQLIYKVLSWQDPSHTLTAFLVLNFAFWLVIQLELKTYGVIFILTLVGFVADGYYFDEKFTITDNLLHFDAIEELKNDVSDVFYSLRALRKDSPSSFCIGMCGVFLMCSFVARSISGCVIGYLFLLGVFFVPLLVSHLPPTYIIGMKQFIRSLGSDRGVLAEEELIPFISNKNLQQRDADSDSYETNETADYNSLLLMSESMPSHTDTEDNRSLQEEDLLPGSQSGSSYDESSDADSFDGALREEKKPKKQSVSFSWDLNQLQSYTADLLHMGGPKKLDEKESKQRKESTSGTDDSEFEIITEDDIKISDDDDSI